MAPAGRRGAKAHKWTTQPQLGDLVLAKVKGYPPWPAKVSKPEDWDQMPVPRKVFVVFFGTREMLVSSTLPPVTLHIPLSARYYYHHYSYLR
jgi:hypothetical protein